MHRYDIKLLLKNIITNELAKIENVVNFLQFDAKLID